jgi:hypothetical protein
MCKESDPQVSWGSGAGCMWYRMTAMRGRAAAAHCLQQECCVLLEIRILHCHVYAVLLIWVSSAWTHCRYVSGFLPRAVYTSGKASTAAGLTASVVKVGREGARVAGHCVIPLST